MARVVPIPFGFTPEQRDQYESLVPAVPEDVVAHLIHECGCKDLEEDLLQEAYLGTVKGVQTYDASKGALRQWVFFTALRAAQNVRRKEKNQSRVVARMWDALSEFCKSEQRTVSVMGEGDDDRAAFTEFRNRAAASAFVSVAVLEVPSGGGDAEEVERLTAARCKAGLSQVLGDLSGARHELLRLHFADDQSVKDVAATRGDRGYRAELVEFHRTVDLVAARLTGMGFRELPPFPPEAGGTILRETSSGSPTPPAKP